MFESSGLDSSSSSGASGQLIGEQTVFAKFTAAHSALLHRRRRRAAAPLKENGAAAYAETSCISRLC